MLYFLNISGLVEKNLSQETFLLITACIAHLATTHPASLPEIFSSSFITCLLEHPASYSSSSYIQDQLVTIIINMAKLPIARIQMVQAKVIEYLLRILSKRSSMYDEIFSGRLTVGSKAALALARLSEDISTAASDGRGITRDFR